MAVWKPDLSPAELCHRAHLQLRHWRGLGDADKTTFWYLRRDDLLDQIAHRPLQDVNPVLDRRLTIAADKPMRVATHAR